MSANVVRELTSEELRNVTGGNVSEKGKMDAKASKILSKPGVRAELNYYYRLFNKEKANPGDSYKKN